MILKFSSLNLLFYRQENGHLLAIMTNSTSLLFYHFKSQFNNIECRYFKQYVQYIYYTKIMHPEKVTLDMRIQHSTDDDLITYHMNFEIPWEIYRLVSISIQKKCLSPKFDLL